MRPAASWWGASTTRSTIRLGSKRIPIPGGAGMNRSVVALACAAGLLARVGASFAESGHDRQEIAGTGFGDQHAAGASTTCGTATSRLRARVIDKALKQNPHTAETQMTAGMVYDRLGEHKKSLAYFDAGGQAGEGQSGRAQQRRRVPVPQRRAQARRGVLPEGRGEPALQDAGGRLHECRPLRARGRPAEGRGTVLPQGARVRGRATRRAAAAGGGDARARQRHAVARVPAALPGRRRPATASTLLLGNRVELALGANDQAADDAKRIAQHDFPSSPEAGACSRSRAASR